MNQATIRSATSDDLIYIQPLVEEFVSSFPLNRESYASSFARLLANESAHILVAQTGATISGYCLGFVHDAFYANGKVAWLEELMVGPEQRRSGIGEKLVSAFEAWAGAQGAVLSALATRRASEFYNAIGYEESATYFRRLL